MKSEISQLLIKKINILYHQFKKEHNPEKEKLWHNLYLCT